MDCQRLPKILNGLSEHFPIKKLKKRFLVYLGIVEEGKYKIFVRKFDKYLNITAYYEKQ